MALTSSQRNEKGQILRNASPQRTVCEVLREINDLHQGDAQHDIDVRAMVREAVDMAKRMDRKLKEYSKEYDAGWWAANLDYEADLERRLKTDYLALDDNAITPEVRRIPSMGGREIGRYLRQWASKVGDLCDIVELGAWLGAGTVQLALGVRQAGRHVTIHSYDRFVATASQVVKAADQGVTLIPKRSTRMLVIRVLRELGVVDRCNLVAGNIPPKAYPGRPIALYVDDACKREKAFLGALRVFGPHWIPKETVVVLMDFWYFERKPEVDGLQFQHDWMDKHQECFEVLMERMPGISGAAFRYLGGEPWNA